MANDSSMLNIDMVDQFGKNIANVSAQTLEIFSRLGQQLQTVNSVWNDDNYDNFQDNFEHNIMKKIQEVSAEMELFSDYIKSNVRYSECIRRTNIVNLTNKTRHVLVLIGFIIIILGGFIIISLLQIVFMIIGWIIQAIFSLFE